jgi:ribosomal protein L24
MIKRHTRKSQQNPQGAIVEREGSIHISNVMLAEARAPRARAAPANLKIFTAKSVTQENESQTLRKIQKRSGAGLEGKAQLQERPPDSQAWRRSW